jgi:endonuclease III
MNRKTTPSRGASPAKIGKASLRKKIVSKTGSSKTGVSKTLKIAGKPVSAAKKIKKIKALKSVGQPTKAAAKPAKPWTAAEVEEAFRRFSKANPEPKGELQHVDPFTLLIAVVLSAQATDAGVNKATPALFAAADTPAKMVALGEDKVRDLIKTIGLYRTKAKNVIALSQKLVAEHGGEVPNDRDALEALPGVGRKTANVVLNIAFGQPRIAVDTHIFRVSNRTGVAPGKNPLEVEQKLEQVVPERYRLHAHHWLILHGRYICLARRPRCSDCLINDLCRWPDKTA